MDIVIGWICHARRRPWRPQVQPQAVRFRCQLRMSRIVTCGPPDSKRSASAGGEPITLGGRGGIRLTGPRFEPRNRSLSAQSFREKAICRSNFFSSLFSINALRSSNIPTQLSLHEYMARSSALLHNLAHLQMSLDIAKQPMLNNSVP